jgi:hypothetical protein
MSGGRANGNLDGERAFDFEIRPAGGKIVRN